MTARLRDPWTKIPKDITVVDLTNNTVEDPWPNPTTPSIPVLNKSTGAKFKLASGGEVFVTPQVKYTPEDIEITWMRRYTRTFSNRLKTYLQNGTFLQITMPWGDIFSGFLRTVREDVIPGRSFEKISGGSDKFMHNLSISFRRKG